MTTKVQQFEAALRQAGHRITVQRRAICAHLATADNHPTPSEVYAALAPDHPAISLATVYNTLTVLRQLGLIIQIELGDKHTHYETNLQPHVNLICLHCRSVTDYDPPHLPDDFIAGVRNTVDFAPTTVQLHVLGLCAACQRGDPQRNVQQGNR